MIRGSPEAAGVDASALSSRTIPPGETVAVPIFAFPHDIQSRCTLQSRSGLAFKHDIVCRGMVFREGQYRALLENLGTSAFDVTEGMRVAQYIVDMKPLERYTIVSTDVLKNDTARGTAGFGSSGLTGSPSLEGSSGPDPSPSSLVEFGTALPADNRIVYVKKAAPDVDLYYGAPPYAVQLPTGTFGLVTTAEGAPCELFQGVIDSDYRGDVAVKILKGEGLLTPGQLMGSIKLYRHA